MSYDVIVLSHLRWGFVWQRPQHLVSRWARTHRVFFLEEPVADGGSYTDVKIDPAGVHVVTPHIEPSITDDEVEAIQRTLLDELFVQYEVRDYLLWAYTPMPLSFVEHLRPVATVYDCMDELSAFAGAPEEMTEREFELLRRADVVFTGGRSLYETKSNLHANVHLFPSSVDADHYRAARSEIPQPADQTAIPRPRLGFAGVVDERMDLQLLAEVADARPDWQIVIVGPVVKIDKAVVPRRANLHYLGQKRYEELPAYLAGWDVALMPFALNEATRFISPTKTLEYLAAGKPVVSTPIADVVATYGSQGVVRIAEDGPGFVDAVEAALAEGFDLDAVDALLAETSWDATFNAMRAQVDRVTEQPKRSGKRFDTIVVGAGFAGATAAQQLAGQGRRVLIVERRNHIGGNAYDGYDDAGVLIHHYGPHIFHTNSRDVFAYLSQFTQWRPYEHRVLASVDGQLVPIPINRDTIKQLYGLDLSTSGVEEFLASVASPIERPQTSEEAFLAAVGPDLYAKFFRNYTRKQWGLDPSEIDASVAARVPTRASRDDRYFTDTYQSMPLHGYTRLFENMLDHPRISVLLQTEWTDAEAVVPHRHVVYTGPIDEFFGHRLGHLPYRSLRFRFETHDLERFQPAAVLNFPNEHEYTRCTEFKWLTGQHHPKTTVLYETPSSEGDPYYPIPRRENADLYKRYKKLADATPDTLFIGRLATYRYYNMDQVVAQALTTIRRASSFAPAPPAWPRAEPARQTPLSEPNGR